NNYLYNTNISEKPWYKDKTSAFLTVSINSTTQAARQTQTEAFFYAVDIEEIDGNDGGFANLYYINSLAFEHCWVRNCTARRGGIISADFDNRKFFDTSTGANPMNDYIDIAYNNIQSCGLFPSTFPAGVTETWGTEGKYNNGTKVDTTDLTNPTIKDNKIFRPDENGLFLIENYNGGTHLQEYRLIKRNYMAYNRLHRISSGIGADAYDIYLTLDSIGSNTINVSDNYFYEGGLCGALYVENKYNEIHGTSSANQGTINFDNNYVNMNMEESDFTTISRPLTRGVLQFENLAKVFINTKERGISYSSFDHYIIRGKGIGTGAVYVHNVDQFSAYKTDFCYSSNASVNVSTGRGGRTGSFYGGGAIYLSSCSEVNIGHPTVDQTEKVVFRNNSMIDAGGNAARGAGAIYAVDVKTLNINDVEFKDNQGTIGGAIAMIGENSDTNLNIYGSTFTNNKMNTVTTGDLLGGAIYYKGDDSHTHSHKIYSSYYLNQARVSTFSNNYVANSNTSPVDNHADDIYLENITEDSDLKYINMSNPSYVGLSEIAVVNSPARVAISYSTLKGDNAVHRSEYSTIYAEDSIIALDTGAHIEENSNPIYLKHATFSMVSYDFRNHMAGPNGTTINAVEEVDDILIRNNVGDYVIGVDGSTKNDIIFKQGMIYGNELNGSNRIGRADPTADTLLYDGIFGYDFKTGGREQTDVYLGGNIHIKNNTRSGETNDNPNGNANLPFEIVPLRNPSAATTDADYDVYDTSSRHFNLRIKKVEDSDFTDPTDKLVLRNGVEDTRLGINAYVILSAINSVAVTMTDLAKDENNQDIPGTTIRAESSRLLSLDTDTRTSYIEFNNNYIERYDNGTGGAIPTRIFDIDTASRSIISEDGTTTCYDNRVIFFDIGDASNPINKVWVHDKESLVSFAFDMILPTTNPGDGSEYAITKIPDQRVRFGQTLLRPIMDYSIAADSSAAIYSSGGTYKVIDIAGNLEFNPHVASQSELRFHSWNWAQEINQTTSGSWKPGLFAVWANVRHEHKACGCPNDQGCTHLGSNEEHAQFGGDVYGSDSDKTCIDVRDPRQLLYMSNHPEYMYVLSDDIVIPTEIDGVLTEDVLNDETRPIRGVKICLNGHKITVGSEQSFLALYDKCFITDCSTSGQGTIEYGTYSYNPTTKKYTATGTNEALTGVSLFNFVASPNIVNELNIYGSVEDENDRLTFEHLPINAADQAFATGLRDGEAVYLSRVAFKNNNVRSAIIETKGTTVLDDVDIEYNTINDTTNGKSLIEIGEATNNTDIYVSGVKVEHNTVQSNGSSLINIDAKRTGTTINVQESQSSGAERNSFSLNKLMNRAALKIGNNEAATSYVRIVNTDFEENYVADNTDEKLGAGLYLHNLYTQNLIFENVNFNNNGIDAIKGTATNEYSKMATNLLKGAGICAINDVTTAVNTAGLVMSITDVTFNNNIAHFGGGMYLENMIETVITGNSEFVANAAADGAALYYNADNASVRGRGIMELESVPFKHNGAILTSTTSILPMFGQANPNTDVTEVMKTGSVIYFAAIGRNANNEALSLRLEDPEITENYAKDGVVRFGNVDDGNLMLFDGSNRANIMYNGLRLDGGTYYPYYGGPVIAFANDVGYNPALSLEVTSVFTNIKYNYVGLHSSNRKVIENGVRNAVASASMTLTGKLHIFDNFDGDFTDPANPIYREANFRMKKSFTLDASSALSPSDSFIFFTSDETNNEMPLTLWNYDTGNYPNHPVLEHYYSDGYCPISRGGTTDLDAGLAGFTMHRAIWNNNEDDIIVYKGTGTRVYVGAKKFATPVFAFRREGDLYSLLNGTNPDNDPSNPDERLAFWGRKDDTIEVDQYTKTGAYGYRVYNGFEKYAGYTDGVTGEVYTAGNYYIGRTSDDVYRTWGFTKNTDNFKVNTYRVPTQSNIYDHFDYIYYVAHGTHHANDISAHTSFNTNFIHAYSETFAYATYPDNLKGAEKNEPGVTNVDIRIDKAVFHITRTLVDKVGLNICLNGNNIVVDDPNISIANLDANRLEKQSIAFLDCATPVTDSGIFGRTGAPQMGPTQHVSLFKLQGKGELSENVNPILYFEGVSLFDFVYDGDEEGAIIRASYSTVEFLGHKTGATTIGKNTTIRQFVGQSDTYMFDFSEKTPIDMYNSRLIANGFTVSSIGQDEIYGGAAGTYVGLSEEGFIHMHGTDTFTHSVVGTTMHWNQVVGALANVDIHDVNIETEKAFFNFEDTYGTSGTSGSNGPENGVISFTDLKVAADNYTDSGFTGTTTKLYNGINNGLAGAKGAFIYVNNQNAIDRMARGLTIDNSVGNNIQFIRATTEGQGAAIYIEDFDDAQVNDYYTVTINNMAFKDNEARAGSGGSIYFYTGGDGANTSGNNNAKVDVHLIDVRAANNHAELNGGFIYIAQDDYIQARPLKNKLTIESNATQYIIGNEAEEFGGAIYLTDTIFNVEGTGPLYAGRDDTNIKTNSAISGGFLWQQRSITTLNNTQLENNTAVASASAIYVDGSEGVVGETNSATQVHDSLTLNNVQAYANHGSKNTGIIVIGTYSDLILDGTVKLWDAGTALAPGHVDDTEVLYVRGRNLNTQDIMERGVTRIVTASFDYFGSYIYGAVEKKDRMLLTGYNLGTRDLSLVFAPAELHDIDAPTFSTSVYSSGQADSANVHIGYTNAKFAFITFVGNPAANAQLTAKILEYTDATGTHRYEYDAAKGSPRALGASINMATLSEAAVTASGRPAADLLGFVAYTSSVTGSDREFKYYEPTDYIYPENDENYIIAVWKDTANQAQIITDIESYDNNNYGAGGYHDVDGFDHTYITDTANQMTFAKVEAYEQLYFDMANVGYSLARDEVNDRWTKLDTTTPNADGSYNVIDGTEAIPIPISSDREVIYMNSKKIKKYNNSRFYENEAGTLVIFDKPYTSTTQTKAEITADAGVTFDVDFIYAANTEIISAYDHSLGASSDEIAGIDIHDLKFDLNSNAAFINQNIPNYADTLYLMGAKLRDTTNARIYAPTEGYTYMYDFLIGGDGATNTVELATNRNVNDALLTFNAAARVTIKGGTETDDRFVNWRNNTTHNFMKIGGTYNNVANEADPVFNISKVNIKANTAYAGSATNSFIYINAEDSSEEQIVAFNNVKVEDMGLLTPYDSFITSYGHRIKLSNFNTVGVNTTNDYFLDMHKADNFDELQYRLSTVSITRWMLNYAATNAGLTGNKGILFYQDYVDPNESGGLAESINLLNSVNIRYNPVNAAFYNSAGANNYTLGGRTIISDNLDKFNNTHNLVVSHSTNEYQTVSFLHSNMTDLWDTDSFTISTDSYIGITATNWSSFTGATAYQDVAYGTWVPMARENNIVFNMILHSDDSDYIIAKRGAGIIITKDTNPSLVKTTFEKNDDNATGYFVAQYLLNNDVNQTIADEPITPTTTLTGVTFNSWRDAEYLQDEYNFSEAAEGGTILDGEGTPRIATIYALWNKNIRVSIITNNGGTGIGGGALEPVIYNDGTTDYEVATFYALVPMGHYTSDATTYEFVPVGSTATISVTTTGDKPVFTRVGLNMTDDLYTVNGWSGQYGQNETWDNANIWNWIGGQVEDNIIREKSLYVRWVGVPYTMTYNYYDYDEDHPAISSGSTAVVNYYGGIKDESVTQHYGSRMESGSIFTPVRQGYDFVAWHSSPSTMFGDANKIESTDVFLYGQDITAYAEWKPATYSIVYVGKSDEVANETTGKKANEDPTVATKYSVEHSFDMTLRGIDPVMNDNRFFRDGYTITGWNYDVPRQGIIDGYIGYGDNLSSLDDPTDVTQHYSNLYNSFIDTTVDPPVASPSAKSSEYEPVELKPVWEANSYRLIFDFNDGSAGNSDTYTGSTVMATMSGTNVVESLQGLSYDAANNYFYIDVTYDSELSNNTQNIDRLPELRERYGWTFEGWYQLKDATKSDMEVNINSRYNWSWVSKDHTTGQFIKATDSRVYAKWRKNRYNLEFVAFDPNDDTVTGTITGSIARISDIEFDTDKVYTIPSVRYLDGTETKFRYVKPGYTYLGATVSNADPVTGNAIDVNIFNATNEIEISSVSEFKNLKFSHIDDGATLTVYGKWEPHHYKIEYNTHAPAGSTITAGEVITTSSDIRYDDLTEDIWMPDETELAIAGYKFVAWATNSEATTAEADKVYKDGSQYKAEYLASAKQGVPEDKKDNEVFKLYGMWMKSPYYVSFDIGKSDAGLDIDDQDVIVNNIPEQTFETDGEPERLSSASNAGPGKGMAVRGHEFLYWIDTEPA
ncbi:MAG: hypothetical protein IJ593_01025, partial [Lachnospiraceae bacterium]|nr:hypothetical protein [Lachnospiraceae bacterium]